jgi:hypothetical protein
MSSIVVRATPRSSICSEATLTMRALVARPFAVKFATAA